MSDRLSIVVPTYNEEGNVGNLYTALKGALREMEWEVVFVDDDSPDGTAETLRRLAREDRRVRVIQRLGRRGLASACIEGILSTSSPYVCVMDADLQHDESLIPRMFERLRRNAVDVVIASRYVPSGSANGMPAARLTMSRLATRLCNHVIGIEISDPLSGFFMFSRVFFESVMRRLSGRGFKILLDMLLSAPIPPAFEELPYSMRSRQEGRSKLSAGVIWDFFVVLAYKRLGRLLPTRFISFAAVGASGVIVHLLVLWAMFLGLETGFIASQVGATLVAMTSNFLLNNAFTYQDRRLHGAQLLRGLLSFYLVCALGAVINVALAGWLFAQEFHWWVAGLAGAVAGAVWNYAVTATLTWRVHA